MEFTTMAPEDVTYRNPEIGNSYGSQDDKRNVNSMERAVSTALGAAALVSAVRRRDAGGAMLAVLGGELVYRGITGRCPLYQAAGISTTGSSPSRTKFHWQAGPDAEKPDQTLHWQGAAGKCRGFFRLRESDDQRGAEADIHVRLDPTSGSIVSGILNALHFIPLVLSSKPLQRLRGNEA